MCGLQVYLSCICWIHHIKSYQQSFKKSTPQYIAILSPYFKWVPNINLHKIAHLLFCKIL